MEVERGRGSFALGEGGPLRGVMHQPSQRDSGRLMSPTCLEALCFDFGDDDVPSLRNAKCGAQKTQKFGFGSWSGFATELGLGSGLGAYVAPYLGPLGCFGAMLWASPAEVYGQDKSEAQPSAVASSSKAKKNESDDEEEADEVLEVVVEQEDPQAAAMQSDRSQRQISTSGRQAEAAGEVAALLDNEAALTVTPGNAGLGGAKTKLNVAARGVNPRFSSRSQFLLDGFPLALSPYGRPQMTLFPLVLDFIDKVEIDLQGVDVDQGPHSLGGVISLKSKTIPRGFSQDLYFGLSNRGARRMGAAVRGATHRRAWEVGASTWDGRSYRESSHTNAKGVWLRYMQRLGQRHRLSAFVFGYGEHVQLPGGLSPQDFRENPFQSTRPHDRFTGARVGGSLRWVFVITPSLSWQTQISAGHTQRRSELETSLPKASSKAKDQKAGMAPARFFGEALEEGSAKGVAMRIQPRRFRFVQIKSQLDVRWPSDKLVQHSRVGGWSSLEWARMRSDDRWLGTGILIKQRSLDHEAIRGSALYLQHEISDQDEFVRVRAGFRGEAVNFSRDDRLKSLRVSKWQFGGLPSASVTLRPRPWMAAYASYGQSFSPPQFLQISLATEDSQYRPERGQSAELGLRLRKQGRLSIWGNSALWLKSIRDYADVSAERFDQPGDLLALGFDATLNWKQRWSLRSPEGLSGQLSYSGLRGKIQGGAFDGARVPWYPKHRARFALRYDTRHRIYLRSSLRVDGSYLTDYENTIEEDPKGRRGQIPAWTSLDLELGVGPLDLNHRSRSRSGQVLRMTCAFSVRNLADQRRYSRTPDRNFGRVLLEPRTFLFHLAFSRQRRPLSPKKPPVGPARVHFGRPAGP